MRGRTSTDLPLSAEVRHDEQEPTMKPTLGRVVLFQLNEDGVLSPATVIRTRATTVPGLLEAALIPGLDPELADDRTVDLVVHGLVNDYRAYSVPQGEGPHTWHWPPRGAPA